MGFSASLRFVPVRQVSLAILPACRVGAGFIKSGMGKTPHSLRALLRLSRCRYASFRSYKLSGACWIQAGHPSRHLGGCGYRCPPIQTERLVDFGGSSFFGRFPRRHGPGVFLVVARRARKRHDLFGMAPICSLGDHDPRSLRLVCPGFQPQARSEAGGQPITSPPTIFLLQRNNDSVTGQVFARQKLGVRNRFGKRQAAGASADSQLRPGEVPQGGAAVSNRAARHALLQPQILHLPALG